MDSQRAPEPFVHGPRLAGGLVPSVVGYRGAGRTSGLHRGLPSPYLTVVLALDAPLTGGDTPEQARGPDAYRCRIVLAGLHERPSYVVQPERQEGVQLAVHPLAARRLFGMPAAELARRTEEGVDVLGRPAAELHERLVELPTWDGRFAVLGEWLRSRSAGRTGGGVRPEVAEAWRWTARHGGTGSVEGMARHVGLTPRHLGTLLRAETGMGPRQIGGLMRFGHARRRVAASVTARGRPAGLARIAAETGYCDQSHLVRDFHRYTGLSPTAWVAEEFRNIQAGGHGPGAQ